MVIIDTLPTNSQDVDALKLETMIDTIFAICRGDTHITGQAAFSVNIFLAHAALRMASELKNCPQAVQALDAQTKA